MRRGLQESHSAGLVGTVLSVQLALGMVNAIQRARQRTCCWWYAASVNGHHTNSVFITSHFHQRSVSYLPVNTLFAKVKSHLKWLWRLLLEDFSVKFFHLHHLFLTRYPKKRIKPGRWKPSSCHHTFSFLFAETSFETTPHQFVTRVVKHWLILFSIHTSSEQP